MEEKLTRIKQAKKDYEAAVASVGKQDIIDLLAPLFERFPNVEAVRWRQYTPHFNDGDPCRFSVHEPYLKFKGTEEDSEEGDYEDGFISYSEDEGEKNAVLEFERALSLPDDLMEQIFGDHVKVTIDRTGVEIDEYDHY